jgi:hypothetical protein
MADVVNLDNVRMVQRRSDARLVEEHAHELWILSAMLEDSFDDEIFLEALNRSGARKKDLGHSARGEP